MSRLNPDAIPVIWLDDNISPGSPAMQHLIASLPYFDANRISVGFICHHCKDAEKSRVLQEIQLPGISSLRSILFSLVCNTRYRGIIGKLAKAQILHATGSSNFNADLISIHFLPADWFWIALKSRPTGWREWLKLPTMGFAALLEFAQRTLNPRASYHVVSRNLANSLIAKGVPEELVTVIPTPYDDTRYSIALRKEHRDAAREEYGFDEKQIVFSFVSQGSYHRKGVMLAAKIVEKLRALGHPVHLMLIGGKGPPWERMRKSMDSSFGNSSDWLHITGFVPDLTYALSASDAFIMPSLYEGFAAVEVEAAAMGIPLLLTAHPGVEMILEEGRNGWLIDFDPEKAADKITEVIEKIRPFETANVGEALTLAEWQKSMAELYRNVAARTRL